MTQQQRVPRRLDQFVPWLISHVDLWSGGQAGPPDIGLTAAQVATLSLLKDDFVEKYNEAVASRESARAKTILQHEAFDALKTVLGGDIDIIDGYAKATGDLGVYARAQLAPPKDATPRDEAPIPTNLATTSTTSGDVELRFRGSKAGGVVFIIQRQLVPIGATDAPWQYADTVAEKVWVDQAIPGGLARVSYRVRTKLTNGVLSQWSYPVPFYFGTGSGAQSAAASGGGDTGATIEDARALKDAQTAKGKDKAG
jgi:hypothetical protein